MAYRFRTLFNDYVYIFFVLVDKAIAHTNMLKKYRVFLFKMTVHCNQVNITFLFQLIKKKLLRIMQAILYNKNVLFCTIYKICNSKERVCCRFISNEFKVIKDTKPIHLKSYGKSIMGWSVNLTNELALWAKDCCVVAMCIWLTKPNNLSVKA